MSRLIEWLNASQQWFQDLGWLGVLAYAGLIVLVQMGMAPLSPFAVACGVFFGFGRGLLAVELGTTLGAALNFWISRHVARGAVASRLARNEKFRLIDEAIGREGWKIIALLRFCPVPFGLANYCYGLTAVRFWPYLLATIVAIVPGNCFFVWIGASAQVGLEALTGTGRPRHPFEYVLMGVGLMAAFVALVYVTRLARAAVMDAAPERGT
jgi:uncharacterized membrane protein YdjX (TVP38/TMEM64 family)